MPSPIAYLDLHEINLQDKNEVIRLLLARGGRWTPIPEGDTEGVLYRMSFPPGTVVEEDLEYGSAGVKRYLITFPDEEMLYWYQMQKSASVGEWNTIVLIKD